MSAVSSSVPALACPQCKFALDPEAFGAGRSAACPRCRSELHGTVFPAFWKDHTDPAGRAERAGEGEAVCFFHPENRAALSCERCGRFICAVCEFSIGSRRICPSCLSSGLTSEKLPELIPWRFIWSDTALFLGIVPLFLGLFVWPFIVFSGMAAVFVALFGWKRPGSLPRGRRRWAAIAGIVGGTLQIVLWFTIIVLLYTSRT